MKHLIIKFWNFVISIRNPFLFIYWLHHYFRKPVNIKLASYIANRNLRAYNKRSISLLQLDTYEESRQSCHPDILFFDNKYWLVCTPYPYGMEEYENPCVFSGESLDSLKRVGMSPIAYPTGKTYGNHLSDPCLFLYNDKVCCIYRDTINENNIITNQLIIKKLLHNEEWGGLEILHQSTTDGLLSPAAFQCDDYLYMYYVSYKDKNLTLCLMKFNSALNILSNEECTCFNMPLNMNIWHIGILKDKDCIHGIFHFKDKNDSTSMSLYKAECINDYTTWEIRDRIIVPNEIKEEAKFPYKSCYIPHTDKILLSFRDKKDRYCLYIL